MSFLDKVYWCILIISCISAFISLTIWFSSHNERAANIGWKIYAGSMLIVWIDIIAYVVFNIVHMH